MSQIPELVDWKEKTASFSPQQLLRWSAKTFPEALLLASSFSKEDMVILDMISQEKLPIPIITLDTGRLPEETYALMDEVRERYHIPIISSFPNREEVEKLTREKGFFSFKKSVENRKECCHLRKVEPLQRALQGKKAWITGIRREQSAAREVAEKLELDKANGNILKINPLVDWTDQQVEEYIKSHHVPINKLYALGYASIGCAPCTRAIQAGDDPRSGRWWWEQPEGKECGIHGYCKQ